MPISLSMEQFAKSSKLFGFLDDPGRQRLMDVATEVKFDADHVVCKEGESGETFWVILEGKAKVMVEDIVGEKQVATLGPGHFFGEISAVLQQPRTATVIATETLTVLSFERGPVMEVLEDYPKVKEIVGKVGLMRSEDTVEKLMAD